MVGLFKSWVKNLRFLECCFTNTAYQARGSASVRLLLLYSGRLKLPIDHVLFCFVAKLTLKLKEKFKFYAVLKTQIHVLLLYIEGIDCVFEPFLFNKEPIHFLRSYILTILWKNK